MTTYKTKDIAPTWTGFAAGKLSAQGKSLAIGISVVGEEVGLTDTGDKVIRFGNLYSKLKWFTVLPDAPPPPPPAKTVTKAIVYFSDGTFEELRPI